MLQTHKYPLRFSKLLLQHCNVRNRGNIADDETITHLATRRIRERHAGGRGNHFGLDSAEVQRGNAHSAYGINAVKKKICLGASPKYHQWKAMELATEKMVESKRGRCG